MGVDEGGQLEAEEKKEGAGGDKAHRVMGHQHYPSLNFRRQRAWDGPCEQTLSHIMPSQQHIVDGNY